MLYILAIVTDSLLLTVILFRSLLFQKSYEYHPCVTMRTPAEEIQLSSSPIGKIVEWYRSFLKYLYPIFHS